MATLEGILREPVKTPYRKAYIKRRQVADGLYESDWFDITSFVTKWGTLQTSIDDVKINQFVHSGVNLIVKNDYGEFNPEYDGKSLFYGFMTRVRSLVKIEAGYTDGAGNSFPTDPTQGIFILDGEIEIRPGTNETKLNCKSIISPFQETRANEIVGITNSITSSEVFEKIRDSTDGSGNYLFRDFITSTAWDIQATTEIMSNLQTDTTLDGLSTWELMNHLAEVEGFVVHATRDGGIYFGDRSAATTDSQFSFYGSGFRRPNVIKINFYKEAINKLYTHIRFKYLEDDTETSYLESGTQTVINPDSLEWSYGRRTYEFENVFFSNTDAALRLLANINTELSDLRSEAELHCVFMPQLEILDRVDVSYRDGSLNSVMLWDTRLWASDTTTTDTPPVLDWASETSSAIEFTQKNFKVLSRKTNLDQFKTTFLVREVEN